MKLACFVAGEQTGNDVVQPQCQLRLDEKHTGYTWSITEGSDGTYWLYQVDEPYTSLRGDAAQIDRWLFEQELPLGWAATHGGYNETEHERLLQKYKTQV
jgi:hypothetical protein